MATTPTERTAAQGATPGQEPPAGTEPISTLASVGRSALVLTGSMAASQAVIVIRELFVAAQTGASASLDALLVGIALPTAMGGVLAAGTTVALVPAYMSAMSKGGPRAAQKFAGYVLSWSAVVSLFLALGLVAFADEIVAIAGSGLTAADQADAAGYLRIVAPVVFVFGLYGILVGVCQARQMFAAMGAATVAIALTSVVVTLAFWSEFGLTAYAIGSLIGPISGLAVVAFTLARRSALPRLEIRAPGAGLRSFAAQALPLMASASILQLNVVVNSAFASQLAEGSVAALRFGNLLVAVPAGAIALSWGKAIYPQLVRTTLDSDGSRLGILTGAALRYALALFVPLSMLTMAVAPLAVSVAFGRGEFTTEDVLQTALVLVGFAPLVVTGMVIPPLVGALNARRKALVLLAGGVINVTLNLVLNTVLGFTIGILGIALATSLTSVFIALFFSGRVRRLEPSFDVRPAVRVLARGALAASPGAAIVAWVTWSEWQELGKIEGVVWMALAGIFGLASYLAFSKLLGLGEPLVIMNIIIRRVSQFLPR